MESRNTKQKVAIGEAFREAARPLSPDEVLEIARHTYPALGIATIYRNIQAMLADGRLQAVEMPGDASRYELTGKEHHDHFHCNLCDRIYDLEGTTAPIKMALPLGFRLTGHEYFFRGTCSDCLSGKNQSQN